MNNNGVVNLSKLVIYFIIILIVDTIITSSLEPNTFKQTLKYPSKDD